MKRKEYYIVLFVVLTLTFLVSFCRNETDFIKNNLFSSRTVDESKELGVYVGNFELIPFNDTCEIEAKFDAWIEFAWEFKYFLFWKNGITKKKFYNFYIKKISKFDSIELREKQNNTWKHSSEVIEPPLGFYFQLNENVDFDDLEFFIKKGNIKCVYKIRSSSSTH